MKKNTEEIVKIYRRAIHDKKFIQELINRFEKIKDKLGYYPKIIKGLYLVLNLMEKEMKKIGLELQKSLQSKKVNSGGKKHGKRNFKN